MLGELHGLKGLHWKGDCFRYIVVDDSLGKT